MAYDKKSKVDELEMDKDKGMEDMDLEMAELDLEEGEEMEGSDLSDISDEDLLAELESRGLMGEDDLDAELEDEDMDLEEDEDEDEGMFV